MSFPTHLRKCEHCQEWTDAKQQFCTHCGSEINARYKAELRERQKVKDIQVPVWQHEKSDPWWLTIVKVPVQLVQLAFYAIVAFLIYLSTVFAH